MRRPGSSLSLSALTALAYSLLSLSSIGFHSWNALPRRCPASCRRSFGSVHSFHCDALSKVGNQSSNVKSHWSPENWSTGGAFPLLGRLVAGTLVDGVGTIIRCKSSRHWSSAECEIVSPSSAATRALRQHLQHPLQEILPLHCEVSAVVPLLQVGCCSAAVHHL